MQYLEVDPFYPQNVLLKIFFHFNLWVIIANWHVEA